MSTVSIPIDFEEIFLKNGVSKGKLYFSPTFQSWVISGHPEINLIAISPPVKEGDIYNDMPVKKVSIENNEWKLSF